MKPLLASLTAVLIVSAITAGAAPLDDKTSVLSALKKAAKDGHLISGQHTRVSDKASQSGIIHSVREVHEKTEPSVWVGIHSTDIGICLEGVHDHSPPWFRSTDDLVAELTAWSKAGGIIELVNHQPSPQGGDSKGDLTSLTVLLDEKLDPKAYRAFWKRMDQTAEFLKRLQDNKVPAMWRPLHEMNADWFWWGDRGAEDWAKNYAALWRAVHERFTKKHDLSNLLWVYSPDGQTKPERALAGWPGDEFVDVVGIDFYNSFKDPSKRKLATTAWELLKTKGKPMGITEVGPFTFGSAEQNQSGRYDYVADMLDPVRKHLPEAAFFVPWYDPWIPTRNPNFNALYQHPAVLNRGEFGK